MIILFFYSPAKSQVTIGSQNAPQTFSVLELISKEGGLRLPQLTSDERDNLKLDALTDSIIIEAAKGLVIYNTDTDCLEFWNGTKWVSLCRSVAQILIVDPTALVFDVTGEPAQKVTVLTNVSSGWTIASKPDWINIIPTGTGTSFSVTATANTSDTIQLGYITVSADTLNERVAIVQYNEDTKEGDGTKTNPYLILTPEQLDAVRNVPDAYYQVGKNIDLTDYLAPGGDGYAKWGSSGWLPLGDETTPFSGSINGDGFTISGLRIQRAGTNDIGLFGVVNNGNINNFVLNITNNINSNTGLNVGGLAGMVSGSSVISNSSVAGTGTISGGSYIGGLAGQINDGAQVTGCYASIKISGSNSVGGLVGRVGQIGNGNGNVTNCYATGSVTGGGSNIGGLVGHLYNGSITNCYATGVVSGTGSGSSDVVGGIVGRINIPVNDRVSNCVALNTSVTAANGTDVGRVAGIASNTLDISNCWALSDMIIKDGTGNPVNTSGGASNNNQGATIPAGSESTQSWWTTAPASGPGWVFDANPWKWGTLPILSWQ